MVQDCVCDVGCVWWVMRDGVGGAGCCWWWWWVVLDGVIT